MGRRAQRVPFPCPTEMSGGCWGFLSLGYWAVKYMKRVLVELSGVVAATAVVVGSVAKVGGRFLPAHAPNGANRLMGSGKHWAHRLPVVCPEVPTDNQNKNAALCA